MSTVKIPEWAKEYITDKYGNIFCKVCNNCQSPSFKKCIKCCTHDVLTFEDNWVGTDESGSWGFDCVCEDCGKNFDFDLEDLKNNYKVVRIKESSSQDHGLADSM